MGNQYWKNKIQLKEAYERGRLEAENEQRQELTEDLRAIFRRLFGIDAPRGGGGGGGITIPVKRGVLKSVGANQTITITEKQLQGLTALIGADKIDDLIDAIRRFARGEINPETPLGHGGTGATLIGELITLLGGPGNPANAKRLEQLSKLLEDIIGPEYTSMYARYIANLPTERGLSDLAARRRAPGSENPDLRRNNPKDGSGFDDLP